MDKGNKFGKLKKVFATEGSDSVTTVLTVQTFSSIARQASAFNMSNNTTCDTSGAFFERRNKQFFQYFRIIVTVLLVVGVIANILILVVVKRTPSMHSVTNVLLCNLAVSDLVTLLWPLVKIYALRLYADKYGILRCKFTPAIPRITFVCSVLTLSLLAWQRYQALVHTMSSAFSFTQEKVKYFVALIWTLAVLNAVPIFVLLKSNDAFSQGRRCKIDEGSAKSAMKALTITYIVLFIVIPVALTLYCCFKIMYGVYISKTILSGTSAGNEEVQMKKKLVWTSILATTAFILCYAPVGIYSVLFCFQVLPPNFSGARHAFSIILFVIPTCLKAMINPFLYAFQSTNYRKAVKGMFRC